MSRAGDNRIPILYLAPWIDYGGSDKATIDWFRWIDRSRFAPILATTQPSDNRRIDEVREYAEEIWPLPDLVAGKDMPWLLFDLIATRGVRVLHIMNSRLGFELLPDLAALEAPPAVVVQLHVEELDRSGYVRYVTTRYGNLVNAFSISTAHLADAVEGYDIPRSRIHVIRTGIDAQREFAPGLVQPKALEPDRFDVLFAARLVEQKDPLLMVEVAERLAATHPHVRMHVIGDGPLEPQVRERVRERGLEDVVRSYPPQRLAEWYAACDALLMTSTFEGVPVVVYEAMAMGLPIVGPALPGIAELLGADDPGLIEPRDDAARYAAALAALADDEPRRAAIGATHRERALGELSVRVMGDAHGELYDRLLEGRPEPRPRQGWTDPPLRLPLRPRGGTPLVSVVIPCFNHGRYLGECVDHVRAQSWPEVEIIVVDDASTEADTIEALERLESAGDVQVIRQERNGGPSRARNAGIASSRGRYVLPVDADNLLLPDAVERLVAQLTEAGEQVGFIYPSVQYFGTRRDLFEPPPYNLYFLLHGNYCDTCSLVDRSVYDAGLRFAEDIVLGHEDWDFALQLAARGIRGEPSHGPVVRYRKHGFTRSDTVEHGATAFHDAIRLRHPRLYGDPATWGRLGPGADPSTSIKARWAPGVSVVALAPVEPDGEAGTRLARRLREQTNADAELIVRSDGEWGERDDGPVIRRIPAALAGLPADAVSDALSVARGAITLVTSGTGSRMLEHPAFLEQVVRAFHGRPDLGAILLADAGDDGRYSMRLLGSDDAPDAVPHSVAYRSGATSGPMPTWLGLDEADPVGSLARRLSWDPGIDIQWRHAPGSPPPPRAGSQRAVRCRLREPRGSGERLERRFLDEREPAAPSLLTDRVRRWAHQVAWTPAESAVLCRHRRGEERRIAFGRVPPPGFELEFDVCCLHRFQLPGSAELRVGGPEGFTLIPDPGGEASTPGPISEDTLGFVGQSPLPLLESLQAAFHPPSNSWVLICGPDDPLQPQVTERRHLGFVETFPNGPRPSPHVDRRLGLLGLLRTVDGGSRRHRVAAGSPPAGELSLELGALHEEPQEGSVPVWIADDRLLTPGHRPEAPRPGPRDVARWAGAPLGWRGNGAGPVAPRARAAARRLADARGGPPATPVPDGLPDGYLWADAGAGGRRELFSAVHPVTGDQLLTPWPLEAADMGYGECTSLGWVAPLAPVTGSLEARAVDVPWASRFGRTARRYLV